MNEFQTYIKGIYGDVSLDQKTMIQLWNVWKTNPQAIINAYNQKNQPKKVDYQTPKFGIEMPVPTEINLNNKRENDDFSGITNFGDAFKTARKNNLKKFKWQGKTYTTELSNKPVDKKKKQVEKKKPVIEIGEPLAEGTGLLDPNFYIVDNGISKYIDSRYYDENGNVMNTLIEFLNPKNVYGEVKGNDYFYVGHKTYNDENDLIASYKPIKPKTKVTYFRKHQQGGTMNNQQELQKAFMAYLIQDAQAQGKQIQSEQDLQRYVQELGENGLKAKYQEFMQKMQKGTMARLGAKLEYYKKLKGVCPEGQELVYFKQGGRVCKACQKSQNGTKVTKKANEVDKFKAGRAQKDACGSKMKKK